MSLQYPAPVTPEIDHEDWIGCDKDSGIPDGGGTYTREVIRHLLKRYHREHEFLLLIPKVEKDFELENVKQYIYTEVDGIIQRLKYSFRTSTILRDEGVDVFHNLTNYGVYSGAVPPSYLGA